MWLVRLHLVVYIVSMVSARTMVSVSIIVVAEHTEDNN